jgi:hypothetical protein
VASEITPLETVREKAVTEVLIELSGEGVTRDLMRRVADVMERHPGDRRVAFVVETNGGASHLRVTAATARRVRPSEHFVRDVVALCGHGSVRLK